MNTAPGRVRNLRQAEHERQEEIVRLDMLDRVIAARRAAQRWAVVRRLRLARGGVYRRLLEINAEVESSGGVALPRRRFGRA